MGKQVFQPPTMLKETEQFVKEHPKYIFDSEEIDFGSKYKLYESVLRLMQYELESSSVNVNNSIYNEYQKIYKKSLKSDLEDKLFYVTSAKWIITIKGYPSFFIKDNNYIISSTNSWNYLNNSHKIKKAISSIGRIEIKNATSETNLDWEGGTGWLYGNNGHIITNAHVARKFAKPDKGSFVFIDDKCGNKKQPKIDFIEEKDTTNEHTFDIKEVLYIADTSRDELDIAVLKIDTSLQVPTGLYLEDSTESKDIAIVGYPHEKNKNFIYSEQYHKWFDKIFCDGGSCNPNNLGVKRLSPGKIINSSYQNHFIKHDCSTLVGSSGSPLLNPITGNVVGLHFDGDHDSYEYNLAVKSSELVKILTKLNIL